MMSNIKIARRLRRDMTPAERRLWRALRVERFKRFHLRRQCPVGPYIADFLSHRARLVIEVDGGQHGGMSDQHRDAWFEAQGYVTHRMWNFEILENVEASADTVFNLLETRCSKA